MAIDPIAIALLECLAAEYVQETKPVPKVKPQAKGAPQVSTKVGAAFDVAGFIAEHIPSAVGPNPYGNGGLIWTVPDCVFRPTDKNSMFIIQFANGAISAGCQHDTCPGSKSTGNHWPEIREHFEGPRTPGDSKLDKELCTLPRTEFGLAERFRKRFGNRVRYVETWGGKWLVYTGHRWEKSDCAAGRYAQETIRAIRREAWHFQETDHEIEKEEAQPGPSEMGDGLPAFLPGESPA